MIKIEVNEGKLPWIVGIGTILFGIILAVLLVLYSNVSGPVMKFSYLVTGLIIASGVWLCLGGKNRKLIVEDDSLCYMDRLGRKTLFLLEDIAYCQMAREISKGNNSNYLKLYDKQDGELCKLEFDMSGVVLFLKYLMDNNVKIECTENSAIHWKELINTIEISKEEITEKVNVTYKEAEQIAMQWTKKNERFGAEWKLGLVEYLDDEILCESPQELTEGYLIMLEGYLLKGGEFVLDKENQPVSFSVQLLYVSQTLKRTGELKICFSHKAPEYISEHLLYYEKTLPKNRYHTEMITINHELKNSIGR